MKIKTNIVALWFTDDLLVKTIDGTQKARNIVHFLEPNYLMFC